MIVLSLFLIYGANLTLGVLIKFVYIKKACSISLVSINCMTKKNFEKGTKTNIVNVY